MSPSMNTQSGPADSNKTLAIAPHIPTNSPTSPYPAKYDPDNIQTDINKHHSEMKSTKYHITAMLTKLTGTSPKTDKQE